MKIKLFKHFRNNSEKTDYFHKFLSNIILNTDFLPLGKEGYFSRFVLAD